MHQKWLVHDNVNERRTKTFRNIVVFFTIPVSVCILVIFVMSDFYIIEENNRTNYIYLSETVQYFN